MFSDNYIRLCKEKGVGVTVASQEIGFSANSGKKWSEGTVPRKTTLLKLAEYFGVTVDELMEGQPTMSYGDAPLVETKKAATPKDDGALLRFALYGDPAEEITDDDIERILDYARYVREKKKGDSR